MIDVASPDLDDAIAALQGTDLRLQAEMMKDAKDELEAAWIPALASRSETQQDRSVIMAGARAVVGSTGFFMTAAMSDTPLSGGLVPARNWFAVELGARTRMMTFPQHSRKRKVYTVTKRINRGLPNRQKYGRIAFDAASEIGTRLVGTWFDAIVNRYREGVGDGSE